MKVRFFLIYTQGAGKLLCLRRDEKAGALYEFEAEIRKASMARRGRERRGSTRRLVTEAL